jgi:putative addiction module component (TIGR02574 family)
LYAGLVQLSREEISRLSVDERLDLIGQLWDSLEHEALPLTEGQQLELDRRLATLDDDRAEGVSWEALRAELERRCP